MSRAHRTRAAAPVVVDPKTAVPSIPSTEPLPSDQTAAAPLPAASVIDPTPVVETAPLPVPEPAPVDPAPEPVLRASLVEVDSTIPLPSDQLTPRVALDGATDTSAMTDAAIAAELSPAVDADGLREPGFLSGQAGAGADLARDPAERSVRDDWLDVPLSDWPAIDWADAPASVQLLRRDLAAAGLGVVILSADTVAALRDALELDPDTDRATVVAARRRDGVERRLFSTIGVVAHDGATVPIGGDVLVTESEFERLRAGGSIAAGMIWADGEDA